MTNYDQIWPNNFLISRHCVASGSNYMLPPRSSASILLVTEGQGEQVVFNERFVCLLITTFQRQVSNTQCSETWFCWSTSSIGIRRIVAIEGKWGKQVQRVPWQCLVHSSKCNIKSDLLSGDPQHMRTDNQPQNVCNWSCCRPTGVRERPGPLPGLCRCLAADCFSILGFNQQV